MTLVVDCVTGKYAAFAGRARRKEFWLFALAYYVLLVVATFVDGLLGTLDPKIGIGVVSTLFFVVTLIPYVAVSVRRFHDTNRSAWWMLISLIPLIGAIWLVVILCLPGTKGANPHGPDPLATATPA